MIVIPQNEYLQLTALQEAKHPLAQQFFKAEQNYEDASNISDPYTRLAVRAENIDQMKALKEDMRNYISLATPKPYRSRAERLLSVLEPHIKWNEKGELIDVKTNRPFERSQLSDLIQHAVRDRRRNISPPGWAYFLQELRAQNVPQMLLNLPTLDELKTVRIRKESPSTARRTKFPAVEHKSRSPSKHSAPLRPRSQRKRMRSKRLGGDDFLSEYH